MRVMNSASARITTGATTEHEHLARQHGQLARSGCHLPVNGQRERAARIDLGQADPQEQQQLPDADRRDQQHEPRAVEQTADHRQLDDHADDRRGDDREREGEPVRDAVLHVEEREQRDAERTDLALREVEDARAPVDEHEPGREAPRR